MERWRRLTLAETGGVANGLSGLLARAGLAGAVADTVGPVGLSAEAGSVAGSAAELGVGDDVHVVDTHLLEGVSIVCFNQDIDLDGGWSKRNVLRRNRETGPRQRQRRQRGGSWTASS